MAVTKPKQYKHPQKNVPPITAWEVEVALRKMKNGKAAGNDKVNIAYQSTIGVLTRRLMRERIDVFFLAMLGLSDPSSSSSPPGQPYIVPPLGEGVSMPPPSCTVLLDGPPCRIFLSYGF